MDDDKLTFFKIQKNLPSTIFLTALFFVFAASLFHTLPLGTEGLEVLVAHADDPDGPSSNTKSLSILASGWEIMKNPIDFFLYAILVMMGWIVNLGAIMVGALTDVKIFNAIFAGDNSPLKQGWFFVRDFFNIFFILILLFSAFSTIFQVEKFHLKRTLLMVILMALLVNFSWPIGLVIIDAGNVIMYFFLQNLFENPSGIGLMASISTNSGVASFIVPEDFSTANRSEFAATEMLFSILFMFLYAITMVTIGAIFILRLVMLAILMVFAPLGFVFAIFPSTQKFASMWWDNMFKWAFIGPIMIFMLALSLKLLDAFNAQSQLSAVAGANGYGAVTKLLAVGVKMSVAIVVLWAGIIAAGKIGGGAAGMITSKATGVAKWGGKKFSGYNMAQRHVGHWFKQRDAQKDERARQRTEQMQARKDRSFGNVYKKIGEKIPGMKHAGTDNVRRADEMHDKRVSDYMNNMKNTDNGGDLSRIFQNARNNAEAEAALRRAAATGNLDDIIADQGQEVTAQGLMNVVRNQFGDTDQAARLARTVGTTEGASAKNHHFASVSQWNADDGRFYFTDDQEHLDDGAAYRTSKQRSAIFGQHPQNAFRTLQKDTVVIKNADARGRDGVRMSDDFENVLGSAYQNSDEFKLALDKNAHQVPDDVFADMRATVEAFGDVDEAFAKRDTNGNVVKDASGKAEELSLTRQLYEKLMADRAPDPQAANYQPAGSNYNQNP